ncbi:MAG TPA: dihydrodipicolinate synthase family protein, partial [Gammaproteobacteria bacterium]|nr:dihydrodipicolinate synthase family protein [Gammaproteobacteria bacterium]
DGRRLAMAHLSGVWLPIVTPFADGAIDFRSYEFLIEHYLAQGITGLIPLGTTGESPTLDDDEAEAIVDRTLTAVAGRVPVFVGVGGNATAKVVKSLKRLERYSFRGVL